MPNLNLNSCQVYRSIQRSTEEANVQGSMHNSEDVVLRRSAEHSRRWRIARIRMMPFTNSILGFGQDLFEGGLRPKRAIGTLEGREVRVELRVTELRRY